MFGSNEIVGQSHFNNLEPNQLKVTSMFATLQGEGKFSGRRAIFLRLAKCNLACSFCFTPMQPIFVERDDQNVMLEMGELKEGDQLASMTPAKQLVDTTVYGVNTRQARRHEFMLLQFVNGGNSDSMIVTKEHPFATENNEGNRFTWTRAWDLKKGDRIYSKGDFGHGFATVYETRELTDHDWTMLRVSYERSEYEANDDTAMVVSPMCAPFNHFYVDGLLAHNCDTWFSSGDTMSTRDIAARIGEMLEKHNWQYQSVRHQRPVLVITGGEPMLQQRGIISLLDELRNTAHLMSIGDIQIETNGIIPLDKKLHGKVHMVISPKCSEKNGKPVKHIKPHKDNLALDPRYTSMKFVVTAEEDNPYHQVPLWAIDWMENGHGNIYVSPMNVYNRIPEKQAALAGTSADMEVRSTVDEVVSFWEKGLLNEEQNELNHIRAGELCMLHGFTLSLQTHLYVNLA